MNKIRILNENDIKKIINLQIAIEANESAYVQNSTGQGSVWPLVFYEYEHNVYDLDIRSGNLDKTGAYGLKLISYNEKNPENGLEKVNAVSLIFDAKNGIPIAMLNAAPITSYRTGAAAAVSAKYLANKDSKNLLVIGNGNIASYSTAAMLLVMNNIEKVFVYNSKNKITAEKLENFKNNVNDLIENPISNNVSFEVVENIEEITKQADIIITATPSEHAIIKAEWLKEGVHLCCMGACMIGHQEIDENIFKIAKIYADDEKQCLKCGEAQVAYKKGIISQFNGEIGNLISGKIAGRTNKSEITLFDSTGLFLQDLETSMKLIEKSKKENIGTEIYI